MSKQDAKLKALDQKQPIAPVAAAAYVIDFQIAPNEAEKHRRHILSERTNKARIYVIGDTIEAVAHKNPNLEKQEQIVANIAVAERIKKLIDEKTLNEKIEKYKDADLDGIRPIDILHQVITEKFPAPKNDDEKALIHTVKKHLEQDDQQKKDQQKREFANGTFSFVGFENVKFRFYREGLKAADNKADEKHADIITIAVKSKTQGNVGPVNVEDEKFAKVETVDPDYFPILDLDSSLTILGLQVDAQLHTLQTIQDAFNKKKNEIYIKLKVNLQTSHPNQAQNKNWLHNEAEKGLLKDKNFEILQLAHQLITIKLREQFAKQFIENLDPKFAKWAHANLWNQAVISNFADLIEGFMKSQKFSLSPTNSSTSSHEVSLLDGVPVLKVSLPSYSACYLQTPSEENEDTPKKFVGSINISTIFSPVNSKIVLRFVLFGKENKPYYDQMVALGSGENQGIQIQRAFPDIDSLLAEAIHEHLAPHMQNAATHPDRFLDYYGLNAEKSETFAKFRKKVGGDHLFQTYDLLENNKLPLLPVELLNHIQNLTVYLNKPEGSVQQKIGLWVADALPLLKQFWEKIYKNPKISAVIDQLYLKSSYFDEKNPNPHLRDSRKNEFYYKVGQSLLQLMDNLIQELYSDDNIIYHLYFQIRTVCTVPTSNLTNSNFDFNNPFQGLELQRDAILSSLHNPQASTIFQFDLNLSSTELAKKTIPTHFALKVCNAPDKKLAARKYASRFQSLRKIDSQFAHTFLQRLTTSNPAENSEERAKPGTDDFLSAIKAPQTALLKLENEINSYLTERVGLKEDGTLKTNSYAEYVASLHFYNRQYKNVEVAFQIRDLINQALELNRTPADVNAALQRIYELRQKASQNDGWWSSMHGGKLVQTLDQLRPLAHQCFNKEGIFQSDLGIIHEIGKASGRHPLLRIANCLLPILGDRLPANLSLASAKNKFLNTQNKSRAEVETAHTDFLNTIKAVTQHIMFLRVPKSTQLFIQLLLWPHGYELTQEQRIVHALVNAFQYINEDESQSIEAEHNRPLNPEETLKKTQHLILGIFLAINDYPRDKARIIIAHVIDQIIDRPDFAGLLKIMKEGVLKAPSAQRSAHLEAIVDAVITHAIRQGASNPAQLDANPSIQALYNVFTLINKTQVHDRLKKIQTPGPQVAAIAAMVGAQDVRDNKSADLTLDLTPPLIALPPATAAQRGDSPPLAAAQSGMIIIKSASETNLDGQRVRTGSDEKTKAGLPDGSETPGRRNSVHHNPAGAMITATANHQTLIGAAGPAAATVKDSGGIFSIEPADTTASAAVPTHS